MSGDEPSSDFYSELLTSREILLRAAKERFVVKGHGTTTIAELEEIKARTPGLLERRVLEWLDEAVSVNVTTTGTLTLTVVSKWPDLSVAIANKLLEEITIFKMDTRQSTAKAERVFIEALVDSAQHEMVVAEEALRRFLEANRSWEGSPLLTFQHDGLQRDVSMRQSVLTMLVRRRA